MTAHKPHQATIDSPGVNVPTVSRMFGAMDHWAGQ